MRLAEIALPLVLVPPVLVGLGARDDTLSFRPRGDTTLQRTWSEEMAWRLEDMEMTMDGSPVEQEMPEAGGTNHARIEVIDEVLAVAEGRLERLRRSFGGIETRSSFTVDLGGGEDEPYGVETTSDLVGRTVVFAWDEDEEDYGITYAEETSGGNSDLLDGLELDMDFLAFLPEDEVAEGDEWEVDASHLRRVLAPGGNLHTRPTRWVGGGLFSVPTATIVASALATLAESAVGEIDGEVTARYDGTVEEDGEKLALIVLEVEVTLEADLTDRYRVFCAKVIGEQGRDELVLEDEVDLVGTGRLLWDVEAGRYRSFAFEGEIILTADLAWTEEIIVDAEPMVFRGAYEISGTTSISSTCTEE